MPIESVVVEKIRHVGGKAFWEIKGKELETIGGDRYIKLPRQGLQHGFSRLCLERNGVMEKVDKGWSLVTSRGYATILQQRNLAQADILMQADHDKVPELFKAAAQRPESKKRLSRSKLLELKQHPGLLTIYEPFELTLKRPVHEREDLVVPFDADIIGKIIAYLQEEGWELSLKRPADLPPGIIRRSKCVRGAYPYQYVWKNSEGKRSRHVARTLEGAIQGSVEGPPMDESEPSDSERAADDDPAGGRALRDEEADERCDPSSAGGA